MDIYKLAQSVENQEDFVHFMGELLRDFSLNMEDWDNDDLSSFLNGISGYCHDKPVSELNWSFVAELFLAARVYE